MNHFPKYLIIRLTGPLKGLDHLEAHNTLPTLDVDAILSSMVGMLEKPNLTGRTFDDAVNWLLDIHGLRELHVEEEDYDEAQSCFRSCLIVMRNELHALNPYIDGRLTYRFKERRGLQSAILEYQTPHY